MGEGILDLVLNPGDAGAVPRTRHGVELHLAALHLDDQGASVRMENQEIRFALGRTTRSSALGLLQPPHTVQYNVLVGKHRGQPLDLASASELVVRGVAGIILAIDGHSRRSLRVAGKAAATQVNSLR